MTNDVQQATLNSIYQAVQKTPFWHHLEFWIFLIVGLVGLFFSLLAFIEAKQAKHAATRAGQTVKIQTIIIDLTEVLQKLNVKSELEFNAAWSLLIEVSQRLLRIIAPFQKDANLSKTITTLKQALTDAFKALNDVRPADPKNIEAPLAIYNAVQNNFATISAIVAELSGLFENTNIKFGDNNATTSNQ